MNSGRRASRKDSAEKTPPAADTVAETVDRRLNELRAAGTLLADYSSAGLGTVADLAERAGLARHRVMRFAQGRGYDGFTAVPSALREELTQRSKGPLGRVRWDIEHGSNSELLLRRARQVSDLALEHRICVAAVAGAGRVTRIAVQRFQRCGRAFPRSVAHIEQLRMLAPRSFFPPNTRATPSTAPAASRTAFSWSAGRSRSIPSAGRVCLDCIEFAHQVR